MVKGISKNSFWPIMYRQIQQNGKNDIFGQLVSIKKPKHVLISLFWFSLKEYSILLKANSRKKTERELKLALKS